MPTPFFPLLALGFTAYCFSSSEGSVVAKFFTESRVQTILRYVPRPSTVADFCLTTGHRELAMYIFGVHVSYLHWLFCGTLVFLPWMVILPIAILILDFPSLLTLYEGFLDRMRRLPDALTRNVWRWNRQNIATQVFLPLVWWIYTTCTPGIVKFEPIHMVISIVLIFLAFSPKKKVYCRGWLLFLVVTSPTCYFSLFMLGCVFMTAIIFYLFVRAVGFLHRKPVPGTFFFVCIDPFFILPVVSLYVFAIGLLMEAHTRNSMYNLVNWGNPESLQYNPDGSVQGGILFPPPQCDRDNFQESFWEPQSGSGGSIASSQQATESIGEILKGFRLFTLQQPPEARKTLSVVFDVTVLMYQLSRSRGKCDVAAAIAVFCKSRWSDVTVEKEILFTFFSIFGEDELEVQSFSDYISRGAEKLEESRSLRNSPGVAKVHRFAMYALSLGLFKSVGIDMDSAGFTRVEQAAARKKFRMDLNFIDSVLELSLFIATAGFQAYQGCGIGQILHSGQSYSDLYETFRVFSADVERYANTGVASGVDHTRLLGRCEDLKAQFDLVLPLVAQLSRSEQRFVRDLHTKLLSIEAKLLSVKIAAATREAPFSILVTGASSVGKSSVVDVLYAYYGKLHNLDVSSDHKYTVSNVAEYWNNFQSHMWAIVLDDIAFRHPGLKQPDKSIDQILNIINSVPMMPDQAAIEKKGTTPLLCKLVIATTNTPDLNAKAYYSNPAAVLRRFPYVVEVLVREEFATPLGGLDASKIDPDTAYPDYWSFKVTEVKALNVKQVRQSDIGTFNTMADFLRWYRGAIERFNSDQKKTVDSSHRVLASENCAACKLPTPLCDCVATPQSGVVVNCVNHTLNVIAWLLCLKLIDFAVWLQFTPGAQFLLRCVFGRHWKVWESRLLRFEIYVSNLLMSPEEVMRRIGDRVRDRVVRVPKLFVVLSVLLATVVGLSVLYRAFTPRVQGTTLSKGAAPTPVAKERENIYYNDGSLRSDFEGTPLGHSMSMSQFVSNVSSNVALGTFHDGKGTVTCCRLTGIGGSYFLTNNHSIPVGVTSGDITLDVKRNGVQQRIRCAVSEHDVSRDFSRDLCIVRLRSVPPRRNIMRYFGAKPTYGSVGAVYAARDEDGNAHPINVGEVTFTTQYIRDFGISVPCAVSSGGITTLAGDCGMPLLADSGNLKSILGIHVASLGGTFGPGVSMANLVSLKEIQNLLSHYENGGLDLVSANEPVLNGKTIKRNITSVHPKSVFRYLEGGSATLYGSFTGFRAQHKSAVVPSKMAPFLELHGIRTDFGRPVMSGYRPWRLAALALTAPVAKIRDRDVRSCADAYIQDVISLLPRDAFKLLQKYDTVTALNGAPGVAFVDSINRSTSAGAPFSRSKKHYLRKIAPIGELQEPVEMVEELVERTNLIRARYAKGELYRPVFTAHLKDEAVSTKKQKSGKTRVFCGAPFDWTVVVREFFLSHIRLIQNYKFDFECAVGTVAQSLEWSHAYAHITKFGEGRIIAGDYGAFDKTMPPGIILESFRVLIELAKYSGNFSDGDVQAMWCIAHDTAYGLTDFNGELVTFWGSNPSGHPLTVIINSIANSLYVRLAYSKTRPIEEFKKDVSLLTYGDDNIMSVREGCDDFNHTYLANTFSDMGIKYTMADKEAESIPFIHISDASFLKRTWVYDPLRMVYAAPLDESSIHKMLCVVVRSKTVCFDMQMADIIRSAHREWWAYGDVKFSWADELLKNLIEVCELSSYFEKTKLPDNQTYWSQFWDKTGKVTFQL